MDRVQGMGPKIDWPLELLTLVNIATQTILSWSRFVWSFGTFDDQFILVLYSFMCSLVYIRFLQDYLLILQHFLVQLWCLQYIDVVMW